MAKRAKKSNVQTLELDAPIGILEKVLDQKPEPKQTHTVLGEIDPQWRNETLAAGVRRRVFVSQTAIKLNREEGTNKHATVYVETVSNHDWRGYHVDVYHAVRFLGDAIIKFDDRNGSGLVSIVTNDAIEVYIDPDGRAEVYACCGVLK